MSNAKGRKPHEALAGLDLPGGWKVRKQVNRTDNATGGHFSCGYTVESSEGTKGYLKALDFFSMLPESPDPARDLEPLIKAFNFERDLLERCRKGRLSHIVSVLDSGAVTVPAFPPPATVQYIIFELADGDIRKLMAATDEFNLIFALRTLHQIAVGLRQLHGIGVAHQDLKPSNVLHFGRLQSSKIGDLGRAAARGTETPHYALLPAGDYGYAPPEALYGGPVGSWEMRRMGCDAYHLGSMICFLLTGVSMTSLVMLVLEPPHRWQHWQGSFEEALVFLRPAFADAVEYVVAEVPEGLRAGVRGLLQQLCEPDPIRRGHPLERRPGGNSFSLERYVAKLDLLARRAELVFTKAS